MAIRMLAATLVMTLNVALARKTYIVKDKVNSGSILNWYKNTTLTLIVRNSRLKKPILRTMRLYPKERFIVKSSTSPKISGFRMFSNTPLFHPGQNPQT